MAKLPAKKITDPKEANEMKYEWCVICLGDIVSAIQNDQKEIIRLACSRTARYFTH